MIQITHENDPETGFLVQIVDARTLRAILDETGSSYERPDFFGPDDEWNI